MDVIRRLIGEIWQKMPGMGSLGEVLGTMFIEETGKTKEGLGTLRDPLRIVKKLWVIGSREGSLGLGKRRSGTSFWEGR